MDWSHSMHPALTLALSSHAQTAHISAKKREVHVFSEEKVPFFAEEKVFPCTRPCRDKPYLAKGLFILAGVNCFRLSWTRSDEWPHQHMLPTLHLQHCLLIRRASMSLAQLPTDPVSMSRAQRPTEQVWTTRSAAHVSWLSYRTT